MLKNLIRSVVFVITFAVTFYLKKDTALTNYQDLLTTIPSVTKFGASPAISDSIANYGIGVGVGLGLLALIIGLIIGGLFRIITKKLGLIIGELVVYALLLVFGIELMFFEEKNSALSAAIISYLALPLLVASVIAFALSILCLFVTAFSKNKNKGSEEKDSFQNKDTSNKDGAPRDSSGNSVASYALLLILSASLLSGCSLLGSLTEVGCNLESDGKQKAHCYQEAALQKNNENVCDKAPLGKEFKDLGSNPPKDKCYFMVAENKQDPNICNKIKGGAMSYSASECKTSVTENVISSINKDLEKSNGGKNLNEKELAQIQQRMENANKFYEMVGTMSKNMQDTNRSMISNLR